MRSNEDDEGNNPLFFNRAPPAPTRGEGEIKLDGEGEIKLDRPSPTRNHQNVFNVHNHMDMDF